MELRNVTALDGEAGLSDFLEQVALVSEADNVEEAPSSVTLLTLHAAKGLEFPIVFIVGLEEGMLPHSRSLDDAEELAEERRLFYVGLTRAEDRLYLSHAFRRSFYGESEAAVPSRFLMDIPHELTDGARPAARRQQSLSRMTSWGSGTSAWSGKSRAASGNQSASTFSRGQTPASPRPDATRPQ
jgi:DNA helicase II / ATP-dependent DNA helicase PcrA